MMQVFYSSVVMISCIFTIVNMPCCWYVQQMEAFSKSSLHSAILILIICNFLVNLGSKKDYKMSVAYFFKELFQIFILSHF
jgi:hypothetical protein